MNSIFQVPMLRCMKVKTICFYQRESFLYLFDLRAGPLCLTLYTIHGIMVWYHALP